MLIKLLINIIVTFDVRCRNVYFYYDKINNSSDGNIVNYEKNYSVSGRIIVNILPDTGVLLKYLKLSL